MLIEETVVGLVPLGSVIHLLDALLVLLLIHNDEQLKVVDLIHGGCDKSLLSTEVDKCHLRCDIPRSAAHNHLHLCEFELTVVKTIVACREIQRSDVAGTEQCQQQRQNAILDVVTKSHGDAKVQLFFVTGKKQKNPLAL